MAFAAFLLSITEVYLWIGAVVALVFLVWGLDRIEPAAHGSYLFRLLLIPGVVGLWPLVLWRWRQLEAGGKT